MDPKNLPPNAREIIKTTLGTKGLSKQVEDAIDSLHIKDRGSLSDQLMRTMQKVSLASSGLTESLARFPDLYPPQFLPNLPVPERSVASETYQRLGELNNRFDALIDVAKHQATLTQAISDSTEATLAYAIQAGEEAKASTAIARTSIELTRKNNFIALAAVLITLASVAFSIWNAHQNNVAGELRWKEQRALQEQEIKMLSQQSPRKP